MAVAALKKRLSWLLLRFLMSSQWKKKQVTAQNDNIHINELMSVLGENDEENASIQAEFSRSDVANKAVVPSL